MQARTAKIERKTYETDIALELNLDGIGRFTIDSGIGFLDHMLTHIAKHGHIDLKVRPRATCTWTRTTPLRISRYAWGWQYPRL
jgi:imidazoleglycerol phosphate dehydratase HisB